MQELFADLRLSHEGYPETLIKGTLFLSGSLSFSDSTMHHERYRWMHPSNSNDSIDNHIHIHMRKNCNGQGSRLSGSACCQHLQEPFVAVRRSILL